MTRFVLKRLFWAIPILFIASVLVFVAVRSSTDPVAALARNPRVNPQALEEYKHSLGLDRPLPMQYFTWLKSFVTFNWGQSLTSRRPVWPDIQRALANTLILGSFAFLITITVGVTVGIISALRQYSKFDNLATGASFFGPVDPAVLVRPDPAAVLRRDPHEVVPPAPAVLAGRRASTHRVTKASTRGCG